LAKNSELAILKAWQEEVGAERSKRAQGNKRGHKEIKSKKEGKNEAKNEIKTKIE
jgi:hypothetical protein